MVDPQVRVEDGLGVIPTGQSVSQQRADGRSNHHDSDRFWSKVDKTEHCWNWTSTVNNCGYGLYWVGVPTKAVAHRVSYEIANGPIPDGFVIDHLCRNTACVNPDHLEAVSHRVNVLRGTSLMAQNAGKTRCVRGHPFSPENTYIRPSGHRTCRACHANNSARRREALRAH